MPVSPLGLREVFAQAAAYIHLGLHPLSKLAYRFSRHQGAGDLDLAAWALLSWLLGSRESETLRKLGLVAAAALVAMAAVEAALAG